MIEKVDIKFNQIVKKDIKNMIAIAFNDLAFNLEERMTMKVDEESCECVKKKACQMKEEINNFIDTQVKNIIEDN